METEHSMHLDVESGQMVADDAPIEETVHHQIESNQMGVNHFEAGQIEYSNSYDSVPNQTKSSSIGGYIFDIIALHDMAKSASSEESR